MAAEHVNTTALMTIGRFSKASRLSLKALRLYDALGLLPPVSIDEETGYRYYHESQLTTARLIAMLRQLDMPLNSVASVLEQSGADARVRVEPARSEAYTRLTKSQVAFPDILAAYDSVEAWLKENGKKPSGSPREVYFAEWDNLAGEDPACDIAWPYEA